MEIKLSRPVPPLGGFSLGIIKLEARRILRNRRTLISTVVIPVVGIHRIWLNKAY
jgi:ABC-2 type transport system permease protein